MRLNTLFTILIAATSSVSCAVHDDVGISNLSEGGEFKSQELIASLAAEELGRQMAQTASGAQLLIGAGSPKCGVSVHRVAYRTNGAHGEKTVASSALMLPTGGPGCSGARPVVLYAHGTAISRSFNMAAIADRNNEAWEEATTVAAYFAAHGYIVVAPNYAGYDTSPLPYHPYLIASQQGKEMVDALTASRSALASVRWLNEANDKVWESGKVFLTGYSEGGYVAMATQRQMEKAGMTVSAGAPMSGPYALLASMDDAVVFSKPRLGGSVFLPLLINGYQNAYGNLYRGAGEVYNANHIAAFEAWLPSELAFRDLLDGWSLHEIAPFNEVTPGQGAEPSSGIASVDQALKRPNAEEDPISALGFSRDYLVTNKFRVRYAIDAYNHPDGLVPVATGLMQAAAEPADSMREALRKNDLRSWMPKNPVMLCGGKSDPLVSFKINTAALNSIWDRSGVRAEHRVVDVDPLAGNTIDAIVSIAAEAVGANSDLVPQLLGEAIRKAILNSKELRRGATKDVGATSPQRVMLDGLAEEASQAAFLAASKGKRTTQEIAAAIAGSITGSYHYPLTENACTAAVRSYFDEMVL